MADSNVTIRLKSQYCAPIFCRETYHNLASAFLRRPLRGRPEGADVAALFMESGVQVILQSVSDVYQFSYHP